MSVKWISGVTPRQKLNGRLRAIEAELDRQMQLAVTTIDIRTQKQGKDAAGKPFKDYSPAYAKRKPKIGSGGRSGAKVNLNLTGAMLRAMQSRVERRGNSFIGIVFISGKDEAAKARANNRIRRFFAFSKSQVTRISRALKSAKEGL